LKPKRASIPKVRHAQGKIDHGANDHDRGQYADTGHERWQFQSPPCLIDRGETAPQCPAQQHDRFHGGIDATEPRACDRVIGGVPVGLGRNRVGERLGDMVAMPAHRIDLAPGEPQSEAGRGHEGYDENSGQCVHGFAWWRGRVARIATPSNAGK